VRISGADFFSSAAEFFRWTGRKSSARSFQHWIMSDDPEAAAAYRSPAPLAVREECSRLTSHLPVTSIVDLPRMQQVDLPSTCYIKWLTYQECSRLTSPLPFTSSDWPTENAAGWPPLYLSVTSSDWPTKKAAGCPPLYLLHQVIDSRLTPFYLLHQVIDLQRMQQVDLPSTRYIKCWPTKNAAGWPTLYLLYQMVDLLRVHQVDLLSTCNIKCRSTKNAAGWPPLYLLHQVLTYQECSRLTSPLPVTSSVGLPRMQ
jgi:hypothetical protein